MHIPRFAIPLLVVSSLLGGYTLRAAFTQPTTTVGKEAGQGARLECKVAGVKCKGTAQFFTSLYDGVPGIQGIETYASEHQAFFTYDPGVITPDQIQEIMERPILLNDGSRLQVFQCLSREELEQPVRSFTR